MTLEQTAHAFTALRPDRPATFDAMAAAVGAFQRARCAVYARYCEAAPGDSPYLPVEAFKRVPVTTFPPEEAAHVFESSGTGRTTPSRHYVRDLAIYERAVTTHFEQVFGAGPFTLVAHLPHYADRGRRSSLLYMVELLVRRYGDGASGFFLDDVSVLERACARSRAYETPLLLFGAAFGLLDLAEAGAPSLPASARIIETGGMKTYRREIGRAALHRRLAEGFGIAEGQVWSEYGMCELMSQCYTRGGPVFFPPPWMRFRIVDPANPAVELPDGEPGVLALFDLANLYTVSALLTEDRAVRRGEGFEVLGRLSQAELRGCNFLLEAR